MDKIEAFHFRYMSHFESSSCVGNIQVPHNELIAVLGLPFDSGSFDDSEEVRNFHRGGGGISMNFFLSSVSSIRIS